MQYLGRDASEYTIQGLNKEGKLEPLDKLKQVEGTNPTQNIAVIGKDGSKVESKSTIAMFELEGSGMKEGLTISLGQMNYKEISYYRRVDNNMYLSTPIAQKNGVDREEASFETKELMDRNRTEHDKVKEYLNTHEKLENLQKGKTEVPNEINITIDGIQYEDITKGREMMVQKILNDSDYTYTREEATEIVNNILDKEMNFDEAREQIDMEKDEESDREKTPWDDAMRKMGF